jgi:hypothetical protein
MGTKRLLKEQITPWLILGGGILMLLVVWGMIGTGIITGSPEYIKNSLTKVIPQGAMLRDYIKLNGTRDLSYLLIYIEKGYTPLDVKPGEMMSCQGEVAGQPIRGKYHLGLFEKNKLVNDIVISNSQVELVYKNIKGNIYNDLNRADKLETEVVPLLVLKDFKFILKTSGKGCGSVKELVAGYVQDTNQVKIFSGSL